MCSLNNLITYCIIKYLLCLPLFLLAHCSPIYTRNASVITVKTPTIYLPKKNCEQKIFPECDFTILPNGDAFVKSINTTFAPLEFTNVNNTLKVCLPPKKEKVDPLKDCEKFVYEPDEFTTFPNSTVLLYGELIEPGNYEIDKGYLLICAPDYEDIEYEINGTLFDAKEPTEYKCLIIIGKVGATLSIIALFAHLVAFCAFPSRRNLPGCNLSSMSLAFLFAYSFSLIGQIHEVLGTFCIISGVFQLYFFLAAFSWMNVMAFDVWRTLKLATNQLILTSGRLKLTFLWYSCYAWGLPLVITMISLVIDNSSHVSRKYKPLFGEKKTCWMTNNLAKLIYFIVPAFTLFFINAVFFILSAFMIINNTMRNTNEQHSTAKINLILYFRLALMMGISWLFGIVGIITGEQVLWFIFDILNSLQGLFVFILFTCSRNLVGKISQKIGLKVLTINSEKHSSTTITKSDEM